nr:hypothetical protein BaRGS_011748 [Batillaria attramentaria]
MSSGLPELRRSICHFHEKYDDVIFDPDHVIVAPGSKELIFLLLNVFSGNVLILSPSWTTYRPQAMLAGHTPIILTAGPESEWRVTPELLEQTILSNRLKGPCLLIMTNPCNPTGTAYTEQHLVALSAVLRKYDVIVLSDEIYARLSYGGDHVTLAKVNVCDV